MPNDQLVPHCWDRADVYAAWTCGGNFSRDVKRALNPYLHNKGVFREAGVISQEDGSFAIFSKEGEPFYGVRLSWGRGQFLPTDLTHGWVWHVRTKKNPAWQEVPCIWKIPEQAHNMAYCWGMLPLLCATATAPIAQDRLKKAYKEVYGG